MAAPISTITVESLLAQAKNLPEASRAELAERLYDTLPPLPEMPVRWDSEEEAETAWQAELNRRLDEVANGTAELVPSDQAFEEIREAFRQKHGGSRL